MDKVKGASQSRKFGSEPRLDRESLSKTEYPDKMLRSDVLNEVISLFVKPRYLEIGVNSGDTLFKIL